MAELRFTHWIAEDLREATTWYDSRSLTAGERFREEVDKALDAIEASPERFPFARRELKVRYVKLRLFPDWILYHMDGEVPILIGIRHCAGDSTQWLRRLGKS